MKIDREFLYKLEICKTRKEIKETIDDCDDDDANKILQEHYEQILRFNSNEKPESMKKILIYVYRKYCAEN